MLSSRYVFLLIAILTILLTMVPAQADKPKPKLLDGELIEEGQPTPAPQPAQPTPENHTSQTVTLRKEFSVRLCPPTRPPALAGRWPPMTGSSCNCSATATRSRTNPAPAPAARNCSTFCP